jgi:tetratricopeptide (TPR) repeat protein
MDDAAGAEQVQPLLPPSSCLLLVTSRPHFTLPGLHALNLDTLPAEDAHALLLKIAPRVGDDCAAEIAALCGCLPIALRLAGSLLAERIDLSPSLCLDRLRDAQTRLGLVDASLSLSYDLLAEDLRYLWCQLSVFPSTFDAVAATAVWKLEPDPAQDSLGELLRYSLVDWNPDTARYRLHELVRLFAASRLADDDRLASQRHHAAHYQRVLRAADELYMQGGDSLLISLALFDLEWDNVQAGQEWAAGHAQEDDEAAKLCNLYPGAGAHCLNLRLHSREWIDWLKAARHAAQRLGDHTAGGNHLGNLGLAYRALGQVERAIDYTQQALAIAQEIGDRRMEGGALGNLGNAYRDLGQVERAIDYTQQALAIAQEIGDRRGEGNHLANMALR